MDEKQFHTVTPESLNEITVNDILTGQNIAPDKINYSVPIPDLDPAAVEARSKDLLSNPSQRSDGCNGWGYPLNPRATKA
ncbi:MAG: hypothetical protein JO235_24860 [Chroococcidiopsidaceae cyanobacterium CP_BM_RX_35]|nr:hypothetical protein [Chroococcidiopsidaceae cyanobacterium CP_BM_RX_35]